jgi:Tol biopolymer transport system component
VLKWSADGQTLYFTNVPVPDGCSLFVNGGDLWRLDLDTGEISELLPFVGLVLALSPDESQLAYFGSYGKGLTLADLATGNEQPIELPSFGDAWDLGGLMWSPDGRHLLLTQVISLMGPCDQAAETTVLVVSIDTLEVTTLIEPGQGDFSLIEWLGDDTVRLAGQDGALWTLNVISGELSPDTAGDTPQG